MNSHFAKFQNSPVDNSANKVSRCFIYIKSVPKSGREGEKRERAGNTMNQFSYVANKMRIECPWWFALWVKHLNTLFSQFSRELRVSLLMQCGDLLKPHNNYVSSIIILPINQFKTSFYLANYALWALFTYWIQTVRQLRLLWLMENKQYVFRLLGKQWSQLQQGLEELFKSSSKESEVLAIRIFSDSCVCLLTKGIKL